MSKIELTDDPKQMIVKMCEGNPGAVRVLVECLKDGTAIDPDGAMGGIGHILLMDSLELYGSRIWMLYADVCGYDLRKTIATLRAWQLGFVSTDTVLNAVETYGQGIDLSALITKVEERLPRFQREQVEADNG